ncbi:hypothetical protein QYE76_032000 [Lolium multiflorum]|uniref:Retrotransposon gag domain-containing protein n=1 Tax=Lolium multiflorum TaxID=4521 RepID=A0AAD8VHY0_LOLMU|nr:hypothetical protein QYE76_032000 [Lolium multiflorum]
MSADSVISSDSDSVDSFNFIDKSAAIGKVFTTLYDGVTNPDKNQHAKYHQVYAIEETNRAQPETSEDFDDLGNPYVDPSDLRKERGNIIQNLDMSFMTIDTRGNIIPKTPEAGYMATQAYILASRPPPGDPREALFNMAMAGVGVMGTAFAATPPEGTPRQNSPRPTTAVEDPPRTSGARDTTAQARVDRARQERREHRQSPEVADEDMCGLPCLQDPEDWLIDYLEMVKLIGGTRATAMQSIQVHLSGAARSWIKQLPPGSIDSWDSFEDIFVRNSDPPARNPCHWKS